MWSLSLKWQCPWQLDQHALPFLSSLLNQLCNTLFVACCPQFNNGLVLFSFLWVEEGQLVWDVTTLILLLQMPVFLIHHVFFHLLPLFYLSYLPKS